MKNARVWRHIVSGLVSKMSLFIHHTFLYFCNKIYWSENSFLQVSLVKFRVNMISSKVPWRYTKNDKKTIIEHLTGEFKEKMSSET